MTFKPRVTFWFVIGYIFLAFGWWTFAHIDDNGRIQGLRKELLEMKRVQAQRDLYANLLETKFNSSAGTNYTLYFNGRVFAADTVLINAFFDVNYPEMELDFFENGLSVIINPTVIAAIDQKETNRTLMFIGEGLVFVSLLIWGFMTIFRSYKEKDELNLMQGNFVM